MSDDAVAKTAMLPVGQTDLASPRSQEGKQQLAGSYAASFGACIERHGRIRKQFSLVETSTEPRSFNTPAYT
jgi:hypothetical protein